MDSALGCGWTWAHCHFVEVLLSHCEGHPIRPFEIGKEGSVVLIFLAPGDDSEKFVIS